MTSIFNIFEQPWLLLIVSGVIFVGVVIFRDALPPKRAWIFWLLPFVIAIAAFAIDYFVDTDREKIEDAINAACKAAEDEDVRSLEPLIWRDYSDTFHPTKEVLLKHFQSRLSEPVIDKITPEVISYEIKPKQATVVFTARVMFDPKGPVYQYRKTMLFKVQTDLVKERNKWLFSKTEVLAIDLQTAGWKDLQGNTTEIFN